MRLTGFLGLGLILAVAAASISGFVFMGALTSEAVQAPRISLDMDPSGNAYDAATNTMTVGAVDHCLSTDPPGNPATHVHQTHLVIQDVEDLVAWQVRFNFTGDRMRVNTINFAPFTDNNTGQDIGFTNLPIDSTSSLHRTITSAGGVGPAAPPDGTNTLQTHLTGAVYDMTQNYEISPDTPAKNIPDDTSYSAPDGGVLASVGLQVVGNEQGQQLFMDVDDFDPNPPGSRAVVFTGSGTTDIDLAVTSLGDGSHAEGATCQDPTPTPTAAPPTPTPPPEPPTPPPPPVACKCFDPQTSQTYSDTSPGSHPDVASTLSLGLGPDGRAVTADDTGDYNFAGIVNFWPSAPTDAEIPDGALVGSVQSVAVLGLLNAPCNNQVPVAFTFMEGTTDITNTVDMLQFGTGNELGVMAGDNPPFEGTQSVKPPPAVTKYPAFLNAIFDPDWVDYGADKIPGNGDDNNGPAPAIKPRFRAVATNYIAFASLWVIVQQVVFEPGTKLPGLPAFDPAYGYPAITVRQTESAAGSATPPIAGPLTDTCSATKESSLSYGVTADNPDTPADEGGIPLRTMPTEAGTSVNTTGYYVSLRDADGDGYENEMDPCPFHADTVWDPRDRTQPIEGDGPDTTPAGPVSDGLPDTCDTTTSASGNHPTDHDDDGFPNRGDNCPLIQNPDQKDTDKDANGEEVGDGIGDACDTPGTEGGTDVDGRPIPSRSVAGEGPGVPDGEAILCVRIATVTVGGPNDADVSECQEGLPSIVVVVPLPGLPVSSGSAPASGSAPESAPAQTDAVAGVAALPRSGDGGGSALPASVLVFMVAAGVVAASAVIAVRVWKARTTQ